LITELQLTFNKILENEHELHFKPGWEKEREMLTVVQVVILEIKAHDTEWSRSLSSQKHRSVLILW